MLGELSNATVRAQKMAELAGEAYVPDLIMKGSDKISWNPRAMISQRGATTRLADACTRARSDLEEKRALSTPKLLHGKRVKKEKSVP